MLAKLAVLTVCGVPPVTRLARCEDKGKHDKGQQDRGQQDTSQHDKELTQWSSGIT